MRRNPRPAFNGRGRKRRPIEIESSEPYLRVSVKGDRRQADLDANKTETFP
jgi:hypothetical protein